MSTASASFNTSTTSAAPTPAPQKKVDAVTDESDTIQTIDTYRSAAPCHTRALARLGQQWRGLVIPLWRALGRPAARREIIYVTSQQLKLLEVGSLLQGVRLTPVSIPDLPTLESADLEKVVRFRAAAAFGYVGQELILDDSELRLKDPRWPGAFPGRHFKEVLNGMGLEEFSRLFADKRGTTTAVFGHTVDGEKINTFTGTSDGRIVHPPQDGGGKKGDDWLGWDPIWEPSGYGKTVAQLAVQARQAEQEAHVRHVITHRKFAALELRSFLFAHFPGVYELHVTVDHPRRAEDSESAAEYTLRLDAHIAKFKAACDTLRQGSIVVRNMTGERTDLQLQTKMYCTFPSNAAAIERVLNIAKGLEDHGMTVLRRRVEAMASNRNAPATDAEAVQYPEFYFELHLKVKDSAGRPLSPAQIETLKTICRSHNVRMSTVGDNYFANARYYNMGRETVFALWQKVRDDVAKAGLTDKQIPPEYCVYDDRLKLDKHWKVPPA